VIENPGYHASAALFFRTAAFDADFHVFLQRMTSMQEMNVRGSRDRVDYRQAVSE